MTITTGRRRRRPNPAKTPARTGRPASPPAATPTDRVLAQLRANGGRVTASRRATIEVLLGDPRHLNAEDIAAAVRARLPDIAESTVYRTLAALEGLGVVAHVHLGHGPSTFHLTGQGHRHLVCQHCQSVTEIPKDELANLSHRLREAYGFTLSAEHFALVGECHSCRENPTI